MLFKHRVGVEPFQCLVGSSCAKTQVLLLPTVPRELSLMLKALGGPGLA